MLLVGQIKIYTSTSSIFSLKVDAMVNPVNTVGIMGKGLSAQFKERYPKMFEQYQLACKKGQLTVGHILPYPTNQVWPKYIFNFPTKMHWRNPSQYDDIKLGLSTLILATQQFNITSIAIPPLGCGSGGLEWSKVKQLILEKYLPAVQDKLKSLVLFQVDE